ncbi:MAG: CARDB domain-containing protein [Candidatus Anammoxibacter sp.]
MNFEPVNVNKKAFSPLIIAVAALVMFSFGTDVEGSFISIKIDTKATVIGNTLKMQIAASNHGDEAAYNVTVSVDLDGERRLSEIRDVLNVNKSFPVEFNYDLKLEKAGKYPIIVTVDYADANMYPFSAISIPLFFYKENASADILCKVDNVEIVKRGVVNLAIKNLNEKGKDIIVRLVLSKELTVSKPIQNVQLLPHSEVKVKFGVGNFSALEGSTYSGFAIIEYEENDRHFTLVSSGLVKIIQEKKFFDKYKWIIIASVSVLLVVFIVLQFTAKSKIKSS